MSINEQLLSQIIIAFNDIYSIKLSLDDLVLQPTRKEYEGTHTFVVFPYLKALKMKPEALANELGMWLIENSGILKKYQVVGGFLNMEIIDKVWIEELKSIEKIDLLKLFPKNGKKIMIEFSSPNTNKPLHLGHLRNIFLGDSIARIMSACGYEVMKVCLVNDRGIHICKSMSAYQSQGNGETPESTGMKGDHFVGKYYVKFEQTYKHEVNELIQSGVESETAKEAASSIKKARTMLQKWEQNDSEIVSLWNQMNQWVYNGFNTTYKSMGIAFDKIYKESETYLLGKKIIGDGLEKGIFFKKQNGSVWIDLSSEGLDEKLLLRADGTAVYITQDLGTNEVKYQDFTFDRSLYVVGNEQDYHFKVLFSIMKKMGKQYASGLFHLSYGMVDIPSGKMKSREGRVVEADDLIEKMIKMSEQRTKSLGKIDDLDENEAKKLYKNLGLGALKYFLLRTDPKKRMLFDPEKSIDFQGNTGPFIQYTYARIAAIQRRAEYFKGSTDFSVDELHPREIILIHLLGTYQSVLQECVTAYSSALLSQYLYDLAKNYNGFYQEIPIFNQTDMSLTAFRVFLSKIVGRYLKVGCSLLGIEVPNKM